MMKSHWWSGGSNIWLGRGLSALCDITEVWTKRQKKQRSGILLLIKQNVCVCVCPCRCVTTPTCLSARRHALHSTCHSNPTSCPSSSTAAASSTHRTRPRTSGFFHTRKAHLQLLCGNIVAMQEFFGFFLHLLKYVLMWLSKVSWHIYVSTNAVPGPVFVALAHARCSFFIVLRLLQVLLSPFSPHNIQQSLFHRKGKNACSVFDAHKAFRGNQALFYLSGLY